MLRFTRLIRSPGSLSMNSFKVAIRLPQEGAKPPKPEEDSEDVYEKMCREEKERIRKRDEESAQKMGTKSLPLKLLTYGAIILVNYYIINTGYEYVANLNSSADKTSTIK